MFIFQISLLVLSILFILLVEEHVPLLLALSVNHCAIPFCSSLFENEILTPGKSVAKYINFSKCRISSHQFSILWSRGLTHSALVLGIQSGTSVFCYLLPDFMKSYLEVGSNLIVWLTSKQLTVPFIKWSQCRWQIFMLTKVFMSLGVISTNTSITQLAKQSSLVNCFCLTIMSRLYCKYIVICSCFWCFRQLLRKIKLVSERGQNTHTHTYTKSHLINKKYYILLCFCAL